MSTRISGGFRVILLFELLNVTWAVREKVISAAALRVYLASHLMIASRPKGQIKAQFTNEELRKRAGKISDAVLSKALFELESAGLMWFADGRFRFSERILPEAAYMLSWANTKANRPVPVPRRILRALIQHNSTPEVVAMIAHLIRCLFKKGRNAINTVGFVRAKSVELIFRVSRDAIKKARRWLVSMGFLRRIHVSQKVMNHHGCCYCVCFGISAYQNTQAGRFLKNTPPLKTRKYLSTSLKKTTSTPYGEGGSGCFLREKPRKKPLNIQDHDLLSPQKRALLRTQVVSMGLLGTSLEERGRFEAACCYVSRLRPQDIRKSRGAILMAILKRRLFHHIPAFISRDSDSFVRREAHREKTGFFKADKTPRDTIKAREVVRSCSDKLAQLFEGAAESEERAGKSTQTFEVTNLESSDFQKSVRDFLQKCFTGALDEAVTR